MTSLRKLIAVTAAAAVPLAGLAQTPPPEPPPLAQIYGTFNVNLQVTGAPNAWSSTGTARDATQSVRPRQSVSIDSSNVGVKGSAVVPFEAQVVYQCETGANVDGVSVSGICNRNSRLGLASTLFGTLFYGSWDTPYKAAAYGTKADDPFGNTDVYDEGSIFGSPGFGTRSSAGQTSGAPASYLTSGSPTANNPGLVFNVRAANSVAYHSPKVMGLGLKLQYSANEFADAKRRRSAEVYSAAVNWDEGPFSVFAAWEDHEDWLSLTSRDHGVKVGAGYELGTPFGTTTIGAKWEGLWYHDKAGTYFPASSPIGGASKYERQAVAVDLKHRTGNHELRARHVYADAGRARSTTAAKIPTGGLGAQDWALGYAYYLTKAAQVYAYWTQIENEHRASYTFSTSGAAFVTSLPAGADPWALGLGMRYAF